MKNSLSFSKAIIFSFIILSFVGCIDISQSIKINKDGSGTLSLGIVMDRGILALTDCEMIMDSISSEISELIDTMHFQLDTIITYNKYGQLFLEYKYSFQNIYSFSKSWEEYRKTDNVIDIITIYREKDTTAIDWFTNWGISTSTSEIDSSAMGLYESMYEGRFFTISIEIPSVITQATPECIISDNNKKATLRTPIVQLFECDTISLMVKSKYELPEP